MLTSTNCGRRSAKYAGRSGRLDFRGIKPKFRSRARLVDSGAAGLSSLLPFALTTMPPKAAPFVVPDLKTGTNAELVEYSAELKRVIGDLDERSKSTGRPSEKLQPLIERRKQVERELNRRQRAERLDEDVNDALAFYLAPPVPKGDKNSSARTGAPVAPAAKEANAPRLTRTSARTASSAPATSAAAASRSSSSHRAGGSARYPSSASERDDDEFVEAGVHGEEFDEVRASLRRCLRGASLMPLTS